LESRKNEIDIKAFQTAHCIIHLAGENIGEKRRTAIRKQQIIDSRVKPIGLILNYLKDAVIKPECFISASATGYYDSNLIDKIFDESASAAKEFLGETCRKWEQAADSISDLGIRTVKIRTGVVLSAKSGAFAKMTVPVKLGIGSPLGSGKQYMPWIHIDDLCDVYIKAIEDVKINGAYNAVSPEHVTNKEFTKNLAHVLHKPFFLHAVPAFVLKALFGQMSEILLKGNRVSSEKLQNAGFIFQFPKLENALKNIFRK